MFSCFVRGCAKGVSEEDGISLHKIPKNDDGSWRRFLEITNEGMKILTYPKICIQHFNPKCVSPGGGCRTKLLSGHIPTIVNGRPLENWACPKCAEKNATESSEEVVEILDGYCLEVELPNVTRDDELLIAKKDHQIATLRLRCEQHVKDKKHLRQCAVRAISARDKLKAHVLKLQAELKAMKKSPQTKSLGIF